MESGDLGKSFLKSYIEKTDSRIVSYFERKIAEAMTVGDIPAKLLSSYVETVRRGKRIRGALVTLGYHLAGGKDEEAIIDASIAIELFHAGVLVHDDIMDRDNLRRGLPTMHKQFEKLGNSIGLEEDAEHYGISQAINLADAAYYMSWQTLLESGFSNDNIVTAGKIYADYVLRVVHGQVLDVTNLAIRQTTEEKILNVLKYKTAEYTGVMPLLFGAALAGQTDKAVTDAIVKYGLAFGWAFQIQDDILGVYGQEEEFGKPIGNDIREGKNTLLTLYVQQHGTDDHKKFLEYCMGNQDISLEDVKKVREIMKECGSYQHVYDLGWKYVEEGKAEVDTLTSDEEIRKILTSLIVYMMERAK
jgi:geranylgeranyl diphosphate synthase type I